MLARLRQMQDTKSKRLAVDDAQLAFLKEEMEMLESKKAALLIKQADDRSLRSSAFATASAADLFAGDPFAWKQHVADLTAAKDEKATVARLPRPQASVQPPVAARASVPVQNETEKKPTLRYGAMEALNAIEKKRMTEKGSEEKAKKESEEKAKKESKQKPARLTDEEMEQHEFLRAPPDIWDYKHIEKTLHIDSGKKDTLCGDYSKQNIGKWVAGQNEDTQTCCGWDNEHWLKNEKECGARPMRRPLKWAYRGNLYSLAHAGDHSCRCKPGKVQHMRWETNTCTMLDWDASAFCQHLGKRTILFIGDSTMSQTASVLMNAIGTQLGARGCQANIIFGPGDTVVGERLGANNRGQSWLGWLADLKPDVVIVNAGAHVKGDRAFFRDKVIRRIIKELPEVEEMYKKRQRNFELIWMTQPPPGCSKEPKAINFKEGYKWRHSGAYDYDQTDLRDEAAKAIFGGHAEILDLTPLKGRPDGHVGVGVGEGHDCMHWCIPGPITIIPRLLLQMMATDRLLKIAPVDS
jgi:hypothetical protein